MRQNVSKSHCFVRTIYSYSKTKSSTIYCGVGKFDNSNNGMASDAPRGFSIPIYTELMQKILKLYFFVAFFKKKPPIDIDNDNTCQIHSGKLPKFQRIA